MTRRIRAPLATALLLLTLTPGCGRRAEEEKHDAATASPTDSGIVVLEPEALANAGLHVSAAGPATLDVIVELPGEVRFDPQRVLEVRPRFAGVVRELRRQVGERVQRGDVVAQVESNESLTSYTVTSSISGRVIARPMAVGQTVTPDASLYTIADLSNVWIEFAIYPNDLARIHRGDAARVTPQSSGAPQSGTVSYIGPSLEREAHVSVGRVLLRNDDGRWEPGLFADVVVTVDHADVPVAVPDTAIVRTDEGPAVFVAQGHRFRMQKVTIGRSDGSHTEIRSGLTAGTPVVDRNAFVLKSELEKASVEE
jgi:cobalt-zinc-cadmium efflux system membrane fusion protein